MANLKARSEGIEPKKLEAQQLNDPPKNVAELIESIAGDPGAKKPL